MSEAKQAEEPKSLAVVAVAMVLLLFWWIVGGSGSEPEKPKTAAELRTEKIEAAFSPWDGSHRNLERWIVGNLRDPDSYEHIKTTYGDQGDHILVRTRYRAKNGYGGYMVGSVTATAKLDGTLINIIEVE